jgi:hypothetical protein
MSGALIPVMVFYPESVDYSLIGTDFTIIQTFAESGTPAPEMVLSSAKQRLEALFGGTATYEKETGKVTLSVTGINRARAETYLDALKASIKFVQMR